MSNKNDRWSDLSMKERADLMNMYITNGISDLKEMKKHYNSFGDGGDTDSTKVQIPTTNIVTTDNYQEKLDEFNQYRQKAVAAFDPYDRDTYRENLNKSDSLGKEIAKYVLNEYEKYKGSPLNKGTWAGTSEAKEPEDINFLLRSNIREDGKDVTEWLKSYVNSEGFDRVRKNQESWWKKRHPYQKILFSIFGGINNNNRLNNYQRDISNYADKMLNYVLDGYPEMSFSRPYEGSTFTFKPRIKEDKEFPFAFAQMHEFDHLFNDTASSYKTINFEAMKQNTNTEEGHDSRSIEKHSDIIGLKYLLYKEGIYDARGGNDITPEQIGELRKRYPELRPLIQMDDEKAAWMINHVVQNTSDKDRLDYVNPDNIAAFGGKLLTKKFENGGNTQFYNNPIFGLGFENHFSIPQNTIVDTPKTPQVYEVQQGDSFIKIANSLGVSLDEFKKVNPLENYNSINIGQKLVIPEVKQVEQPEIRQLEESKFNQYTVGEGDSLSVIAKKNNMNLDALIKANPQIKNPNIISVGQKINLTSPTTPKKVREKQWISVDELREKEKEYNKTNLGAIQGATHDSNYVVIDKKGKKLTVYDSDNNVVYETSDISTGLSGNDYNTKTFTRNGRDVYGEGNMSTPAGVTRISSMDMYHGAPSFQRVRLDSYGNPKKVYDKNGKEIDDTINSSFHLGSIDKLYSSNGCVRMSKKALNDLSKYIDVGTLVYTLPDKNESRFVLKDGNLNYEADNPYGITEEGKEKNKYGHDMVYQDDYNVFNNKTSSPIKIEYTGNTKNPFKKDNIESIISGITSNKESLQKAFNVSDQHFNKIAQLALGILEQESKFGTHYRYVGKQTADKIPFTNYTATVIANNNPYSNNVNGYVESNYQGETLLDFIKHVSGNNTYDSLGMGQIKMEGDNEETQKMYRMFNVTPENVRSDEKTAEAIMIRLLSMYKNEVQGREFKNKETGAIIDPYDALLYKYKGGTAAKVLRKGEATGKNTYVLNVKNYAKDFKFYTYK